MTAPADYWDGSYPPSVLHPTPPPVLVVELGEGFTAGVAVVDAPVSIVVELDGESVSPSSVDWGDGSTDATMVHTYLAPILLTRITAHDGPTSATSAAFTVQAAEPLAQVADADPPAPKASRASSK